MKSFIVLLVVTGSNIFACNKEPVDPAVQKMSAVRGYVNWYIGDFRCGVFVPPQYSPEKTYPVMIFLHGKTDTTSWNLPWYNEPYVSKDPCIVLTPKCPPEDQYGWGSSWYPLPSPMMAKAYEMLELVEKTFNLDKNRYYIYGSSMGGYGTFAAIRQNPDMFAAAYVECGNSSTEIASLLTDIPLWMFHGSVDPIVPVQPTRDLYKAVVEAGGKQIRYTEYPGVGHNVWDYTPREVTLKTWFLAQRKGVIHAKPSPVYGFSAEQAESSVVLHWEIPVQTYPPADDDIWFCRIYRDGFAIGEIYNNQSSFTDSTVVPDQTYHYTIRAINYYFKESDPLPDITVITGH